MFHDKPSIDRYLYQPRDAECRDCKQIYSKRSPTHIRCEPCRASHRARMAVKQNAKTTAKRRAARSAWKARIHKED
jgi:Zn finger protein HypA/HybF involved in hydrogenase expression